MVEIEEVKENFESMLHTEVARERIILQKKWKGLS